MSSANSTGEQFIPRDSEIHQLVISQLPQIATGQDCEYWLKVLQAVLGLSTAACSCRNWHCMFQHWLSGRGSGPPIWKTLFDKLENSDIKELQRIARFLKARLHGMCSCMCNLLGCTGLTAICISSSAPPSMAQSSCHGPGWRKMGAALLVASCFLDPSRKKRTRFLSQRKSPPTLGTKCTRRLVIEECMNR